MPASAATCGSRRRRAASSSWMRRRTGRLRPFVKVAGPDGRGRPERAARAGVGRGAGLHAAGRPGHADHDRSGRAHQMRADQPVPARRRCAGGLAGSPRGRACCRPTTRRCSRASWPVPRTGTCSGTAAWSRRRMRRDAGRHLQADHRSATWRARGLRAPRLHAAQPDAAAREPAEPPWACWTSRMRCTARSPTTSPA